MYEVKKKQTPLVHFDKAWAKECVAVLTMLYKNKTPKSDSFLLHAYIVSLTQTGFSSLDLQNNLMNLKNNLMN